MRLPDKWYQKYKKKDVARHKSAFGRNKTAENNCHIE